MTAMTNNLNSLVGLQLWQRHRDLCLLWLLSFGSLIAAFPFYSLLVFVWGFDREAVADVFSIQVTMAYWLGIVAAALKLPSLRGWTGLQRLHVVCLTFMIVSYSTHLSWELAWLLLHEQIAESRDALWAYTWWAYIDGGDIRYLHAEPNFMMIEVLSVCNGLIGFTGLALLFRSAFKDYRGTLLCMSTGVTHTVLTWYYYGTEFLTGFASVNTASFIDLWVKFILLNGPWLIFPWCVLIWGYQLLGLQLRAQHQS